jgi:hypothetical protein
MANQAPSQKSIARALGKKWNKVSFATRVRAYETSPTAPVSAYFPTRLARRKLLAQRDGKE